jgi:PHD/YefM family antitoxin component YafN of YafNO toxin-antitoxin module
MKNIRMSEDVITLAEFKTKAPEYIEKIRMTLRPLMITQNGKAAGILIAPEEYDEILAYQSKFVAAVEAGMKDIEEGRTYTTEQVRKKLGLKKNDGGKKA